jgi:integrase
MPKYRTTFRTAAGESFPPLHVQAQIVKGKLYTHWRGAGDRCALKGARLLRMEPNGEGPIWIVECAAKWWNVYFALRHGKPLPADEGAEPVVEPGHVVPGSWDALMAHFKLHNDGWKKLKKRTSDKHSIYMGRISEIIGTDKVATTKPATIKEWISKVRFGDPNASDPKKRAPRTGAAKAYYTIFGLLYDHAMDPHGLAWVAGNPVRGKYIEKPKTLNKAGLHTLTEPEVEKLRAAYPDYASDERALLEIGIAWGARASDLALLGWKDIAGGEITFTPIKTENSTGAVVVLPVKGEHLLAVLAHRSKTDTFFFQQPPKGSNQWNRHKIVAFKHEGWDYTRMRKTWKEMRELAGIGDAPTLHSMRKCFATRMANKGANPQDIADALGDTLASAMIYTEKRNKRAGSARAFNAALAA